MGKIVLYVIAIFSSAPFDGAEQGHVQVTAMPFTTFEQCLAAKAVIEQSPTKAKARRVSCCNDGKCDDAGEPVL